MAGRRRIWAEVSVCFAPLLAVLLYVWMLLMTVEFDEMCAHGFFAEKTGRFLREETGAFPPRTVCEHERGTVASGPLWQIVAFYALLLLTVVAAVVLYRNRSSRKRRRDAEPRWAADAEALDRP
ncbi:hypothetical protein [Kitasatospora sp. NPDC002965]|uniref:hypothetical protein n=1 Tax=Kitasatospora sp. NPDC002965 TaxID=3154775 RepID=UPI0033B98DE8